MPPDCPDIISPRRFLHNSLFVATATQLLPAHGLLAQDIPVAAHMRADGKPAKITTLPLRHNPGVLAGGWIVSETFVELVYTGIDGGTAL